MIFLSYYHVTLKKSMVKNPKVFSWNSNNCKSFYILLLNKKIKID